MIVETTAGPVQLREMEPEGKTLWLRIHAECALLRAGHRLYAASDLDLQALQAAGVQDPFAVLAHMNAGRGGLTEAEIASLFEAEAVLGCLALCNAGLAVDQAARVVVSMAPVEVASLIRAQDTINGMDLLARLTERMLVGELLRRVAGVDDGQQ